MESGGHHRPDPKPATTPTGARAARKEPPDVVTKPASHGTTANRARSQGKPASSPCVKVRSRVQQHSTLDTGSLPSARSTISSPRTRQKTATGEASSARVVLGTTRHVSTPKPPQDSSGTSVSSEQCSAIRLGKKSGADHAESRSADPKGRTKRYLSSKHSSSLQSSEGKAAPSSSSSSKRKQYSRSASGARSVHDSGTVSVKALSPYAEKLSNSTASVSKLIDHGLPQPHPKAKSVSSNESVIKQRHTENSSHDKLSTLSLEHTVSDRKLGHKNSASVQETRDKDVTNTSSSVKTKTSVSSFSAVSSPKSSPKLTPTREQTQIAARGEVRKEPGIEVVQDEQAMVKGDKLASREDRESDRRDLKTAHGESVDTEHRKPAVVCEESTLHTKHTEHSMGTEHRDTNRSILTKEHIYSSVLSEDSTSSRKDSKAKTNEEHEHQNSSTNYKDKLISATLPTSCGAESHENDPSLSGTPKKQIPGPKHISTRGFSVEEISPASLKHIREFWSPPTHGSDDVAIVDPNSGEAPRLNVVSEIEKAERKEEREEEEKVEEAARMAFFKDRRPSAAYFTPGKRDDFPWLTWDSLIHPDQADLHPSPQDRLEAARDPNFILHLVLDVKEVIGQGQYGTVYSTSLRSPRCSGHPQGQERKERMALKKLAKAGQESTVHALAEQRALIVAKDCPFIVTLFSCFQTKLAFYLLMELAEGGSLTDVLTTAGRFPEVNVRFYGAQLLAALSFLHDRDILHRDLKVDNVLLDAAGYVRLCDFGLSMDGFEDGDQVCSPCGTLFYVAPEVLRGEPYSKTADWWSYGVLLFFMATGALPFEGQNIQSLYIAVTRKEPSYPSFLSPGVISFTRKMLMKNPNNRPGNSTEQRQSLQDDAFFSGLDWLALHERSLVPPELPKRCLLPKSTSLSEPLCGASNTAFLSASFPLDPQEMTPAERDRQSKQTRSRSLDPTGLFAVPTTDQNVF